MSKPIKYRVISFKGDIIILQRMTEDKVNPGQRKPSRIDRLEKSIVSLREIVIEGFRAVNSRLDRVENRLDKVEDVLKRNNLR